MSTSMHISIRSGDIRDQSRKLSKLVPKSGRCFALPKFRGQAFQKLYGTNSRLEKFREDTPTNLIIPALLFCSHVHRSGELIWFWPFWFWPCWSVAVLDFQFGRFGLTCGRFDSGRFGL